MNKWQNMNYAAPFTGDAYAFLLPGNFSFETSVATASADQVFSSQDGFMNALPLISFFDCATVPAGPHFTVLPDMPDLYDTPDKVAGYTILQHIARSFTRWITVTAKTVRQLVCRTYRIGRTVQTCLTGVQILRKIAILRF